MKKVITTNIVLRKVLRELKKASEKHKARIWRAIAEELEKPSRKRRAVNISRINRYSAEGEIVVVPGKVLGAGNLDHPVTVAALSFTKTAVEKIRAAGGKAMFIVDLIKENPRGSNVKIIG